MFHIVSATLLVCHPPPSSTLSPPNNMFIFLSPYETSLLSYHHLSPKQKALFPARAASWKTVLCMLINKAVGFFPHPEDLNMSPPG